MGTTYKEHEWGKDLTDERADELDDDREKSWLLNDEPPRSKPTSPSSAVHVFGSACKAAWCERRTECWYPRRRGGWRARGASDVATARDLPVEVLCAYRIRRRSARKPVFPRFASPIGQTRLDQP